MCTCSLSDFSSVFSPTRIRIPHSLAVPAEACKQYPLPWELSSFVHTSIMKQLQGETTFTRSELNAIASCLSGDVQHSFAGPFSRLFNSHYNIVTGNYDANVLMQAVQTRGAEAAWFDRRKGAAALNFSDPNNKLIGIILNHPTERFSGIWKGRHWSALRNIGGVWYDLDSDLAAPEPVGNGDEEVKQFMDQCFSGGSEAFLVFKCEVK